MSKEVSSKYWRCKKSSDAGKGWIERESRYRVRGGELAGDGEELRGFHVVSTRGPTRIHNSSVGTRIPRMYTHPYVCAGTCVSVHRCANVCPARQPRRRSKRCTNFAGYGYVEIKMKGRRKSSERKEEEATEGEKKARDDKRPRGRKKDGNKGCVYI